MNKTAAKFAQHSALRQAGAYGPMFAAGPVPSKKRRRRKPFSELSEVERYALQVFNKSFSKMMWKEKLKVYQSLGKQSKTQP